MGLLVLCGLVLCLFRGVCVHLTSQLAQIGIGGTLGPLGIGWGDPWVFPCLGTRVPTVTWMSARTRRVGFGMSYERSR